VHGDNEFLAGREARELSIGVDRREVGKNSHNAWSLVQGLHIRVDG
jgi:hypothetical protein